jgi:hypothetical protein
MTAKHVMSRTMAVGVAAALMLASQSPVWAQGMKTGFGEDTTRTQGNSGKTNDNANPDNEGQTVTTTTGPRGQLKNGNTGCNNCETLPPDLPGKNR